MLSSTNNNLDIEKWQEIILDKIQSDDENCSDNELPLSSIVTTNKIDTEKWQDIMLNNIQSNMENESDNELHLSLPSISTINDNHRIAKHQEINLDDIQSDIEIYSDNELPLSSIANILPPNESCKIVKSKVLKPESIDCRKLNVNHNTSDSNQISIKEQSIDKPMRKYGCDICGKIFLRRISIIEHFRISLCFPDSPIDFKHNSLNYHLRNKSKNSISYISNISNLGTNEMKDNMTYKCRICQNIIKNKNLIKRQHILHTDGGSLCNICSVLNNIACGNNHHLKEKYTWKCKTCGQSYTKLSVLKTHRCICPKNKLFNCYKCHKSFKNINVLEKHKIIHKLNCDICHKQFFKQSSLTRHKRIHDLRNTDQCNVHLKLENSSKSKHTNRINNLSQNYVCSRCSKVFHTRSDIMSHIFENHQEDYSKYSCDKCTNICNSSRDFILHLEKNYFKCDVCPQSFTTSHRLQQHYRWHLGINNFNCQYCPEQFSKCSLYLSHEKTHTREKPFRCNFCGKWFPESSNINIHLKPYKPFACDICQKPYTQMSSLLFHKRIHAKDSHLENKSCNQLSTLEVRTKQHYTKVKQFKCTVCAKSFYHSRSLSAHLKTHKNNKNVKKSFLNKIPQENDICNKCDSCQKLFYDQNILTTHRCKSCICTCCQKVFYNISKLKRHYKYMQQKNNKPFYCDLCKLSFMCSTSLNEHRKEHTQFEKKISLKFNVNNEINAVKEEIYLNEEYKCDLCKKTFCNQTQIFAHILETHY